LELNSLRHTDGGERRKRAAHLIHSQKSEEVFVRDIAISRILTITAQFALPRPRPPPQNPATMSAPEEAAPAVVDDEVRARECRGVTQHEF
jgi:hypothetical protein